MSKNLKGEKKGIHLIETRGRGWWLNYLENFRFWTDPNNGYPILKPVIVKADYICYQNTDILSNVNAFAVFWEC